MTAIVAVLRALPHVGYIVPGEDAYVLPSMLAELVEAGHARRSWALGNDLRSIELTAGGIVKSAAAWTDHPGDLLLSLLEECYSMGVERPSGYGDIFHRRFQSPTVRLSPNALLSSAWRGGWEQAREIGLLKGRWKKYDINQAYLWAGTRGLPDPHTYSYSDELKGRGVWLVEIAPHWELPYPMNTLPRVLVSHEELAWYGSGRINVKRVLGGVTWRREIDLGPMIRAIEDVSCSKAIARTYWGRWVSKTPVDCRTYAPGGAVRCHWEMRNHLRNVVWAHLIVSRVKMRVWEADRSPAHVYVDSIITSKGLPVGSGLGEWREVKDYPNGIHIFGTGTYGEPGAGLDVAIGQPRGSLDRINHKGVAP